MNEYKEIKRLEECDEEEIEELKEENNKLKVIKYDTDYGIETVNLIPEGELIKINKNKYMIEIGAGKFVDLKQVYLENKALKTILTNKNKYIKEIEKALLNDCVVPVQKIKDKIEELNHRIDKYREYTEKGIETDVEWVDNVADRQTLKILQDLLEEEDK